MENSQQVLSEQEIDWAEQYISPTEEAVTPIRKIPLEHVPDRVKTFWKE